MRKNRKNRMQRVSLKIYDGMQKAIRTGIPYQPPLNPPPTTPLPAPRLESGRAEAGGLAGAYSSAARGGRVSNLCSVPSNEGGTGL